MRDRHVAGFEPADGEVFYAGEFVIACDFEDGGPFLDCGSVLVVPPGGLLKKKKIGWGVYSLVIEDP